MQCTIQNDSNQLSTAKCCQPITTSINGARIVRPNTATIQPSLRYIQHVCCFSVTRLHSPPLQLSHVSFVLHLAQSNPRWIPPSSNATPGKERHVSFVYTRYAIAPPYGKDVCYPYASHPIEKASGANRIHDLILVRTRYVLKWVFYTVLQSQHRTPSSISPNLTQPSSNDRNPDLQLFQLQLRNTVSRLHPYLPTKNT